MDANICGVAWRANAAQLAAKPTCAMWVARDYVNAGILRDENSVCRKKRLTMLQKQV